MAALLQEIEKGLLELAEDEAEVVQTVVLDRLEGGSLSLVLESPDAPEAFAMLTARLAERLLSAQAQSSPTNPRIVNALLGFNHRHGCEAQVFRRDRDAEPMAVLAVGAEEPLSHLIEDRTYIYGILERVGGAEPKAWLRLHDGRRLVCRLPADRVLARELAPYLYREIGLSGTATYDLVARQHVAFQAEELTYRDTPLMEAFAELEKKIGRYWNVDVMAVIREERGEYGE